MMSGGKMSSREFEECLCAAMKGGEPGRVPRDCGERQEMKKSAEGLPGETAYMRRTAALAGQEAEKRFDRGTGPRRSFRGFLLLQIRFIGLRMWAVQMALFAALGSVLWVLMGRGFWQEERYVVRFLCGLSLAAAVSALPFIYRSFRYRMHETEASSRYSFAGVLLAKMLMTAMGDAALLGAVFLGTVLWTGLPVGSTFLYLLLPFLLANWLSLSLMGRIPAPAFPAACMAAGAVLLAASGIAGRLWDGFYQQTLTPGWLAVCALVTLLCIRQAGRSVRDAVYPELRMA